MKKIGVIGGGILGLSIAHALVLTNKYKVHLFEKENEKNQKREKHTRANRRVITSSIIISHTTYRPLLTTT